MESEKLLFQIKQLQGTGKQSLDEREAVLELRDKLKVQRDREGAVVAGLMLLFGHKVLKDLVRIVWESEAPLLVRSFVEQQIDPKRGIVTGLEKIRLHRPGDIPGYGDVLPLAVYMPSADILAIMEHKGKLKQQYPRLATDNISELPKDVQFQRAVPAVIREIIEEDGVPLEEMERRNWFDMSAWKFTI